MSKPDYATKALCFESGAINIYRQLRYANYRNDVEKRDALLFDINSCFDDVMIKECNRIYNNDACRKNRLTRRIDNMLTLGKCCFLTLTFKPDTLNNTNAETRKKYVKRFLKNNYEKYIANIDFGSKNQREHYHAVVLLNDLANFDEWHKYGAIKNENIWQTNSAKKLAKYVSKLTNHAIKETVKRSAIIYSRDN